MDVDKIKMKYHMGVWKEIPGYPTPEDIIYELNLYLDKEGRSNKEFSESTFNSFLPKGWENSDHGKIIRSMIESGEFERIEKNTGGKSWYVIRNNPHI